MDEAMAQLKNVSNILQESQNNKDPNVALANYLATELSRIKNPAVAVEAKANLMRVISEAMAKDV